MEMTNSKKKMRRALASAIIAVLITIFGYDLVLIYLNLEPVRLVSWGSLVLSTIYLIVYTIVTVCVEFAYPIRDTGSLAWEGP